MTANGARRTLLCSMLLLVLSVWVAQAEEPTYTVGDFAVDLARAVTQKEYEAEGALAILQKIGVALEERELDARVSEAYFVDSLNQLGLNLTTSNPDNAVTQADAKKVLGAFWNPGLSAEDTPPEDPNFFCKFGANKGNFCVSDDDCPDSFCWKPPGQIKKVASPSN